MLTLRLSHRDLLLSSELNRDIVFGILRGLGFYEQTEPPRLSQRITNATGPFNIRIWVAKEHLSTLWHILGGCGGQLESA